MQRKLVGTLPPTYGSSIAIVGALGASGVDGGQHTPGNLPEMIRLTSAQIESAAQTLARAFQEDPMLTFVIPNPVERERFSPRWFRCIAQYGVVSGEAYASSPIMEGVAVWFPPQVCAIFPPMIVADSDVCDGPWHRSEFLLRAGAIQEHLFNVRKRHAPFPHWYLQLLGVEPQHRGKGYGASLLTPMLAKCDKANLPCCLNTENERNVAFYEHFGFTVIEKTTIPGAEFGSWFMVRSHKPRRN